MAAVHKIAGGFTVSISTIATEFQMDRKTVARRLDAAGLIPADHVRGYPVYRLREAVKAIFGLSVDRRMDPDGPEPVDPAKLPPMERRAWYQSENERLDVEAKKRQLVPAAEVESEFAAGFKLVVHALDTLGDRLERDCALSGEQVDLVQKAVDQLREELYRDQVGSVTDSDSDP